MRTKFYLLPHPDGGWFGRQDKEEHYLIVSPRKQDVLDFLINACDRENPCDILIHNEAGELMEERTIGSKSFPR